MSHHPQTTAKLFGHPIHPMLVPLPIGFLIATFICDLVFWGTLNESWAIAAMWLLGSGLVAAALAATAGLIDFAGDRRIRDHRDAWLHMGGNVIAVMLALASFFLRWSQGAAEAALPWGLWLSLIVTGLLAFTGWKGGELVFRHGVGVLDEADRSAAAGTAHEHHDEPGWSPR